MKFLPDSYKEFEKLINGRKILINMVEFDCHKAYSILQDKFIKNYFTTSEAVEFVCY